MCYVSISPLSLLLCISYYHLFHCYYYTVCISYYAYQTILMAPMLQYNIVLWQFFWIHVLGPNSLPKLSWRDMTYAYAHSHKGAVAQCPSWLWCICIQCILAAGAVQSQRRSVEYSQCAQRADALSAIQHWHTHDCSVMCDVTVLQQLSRWTRASRREDRRFLTEECTDILVRQNFPRMIELFLYIY